MADCYRKDRLYDNDDDDDNDDEDDDDDEDDNHSPPSSVITTTVEAGPRPSGFITCMLTCIMIIILLLLNVDIVIVYAHLRHTYQEFMSYG